MHQHFKTRIKDAQTMGMGIYGILDNDIKWGHGKTTAKWFNHDDFGSFTGLTNVIVHWTMRMTPKGQAGFDISINIEKIKGDQVFEFEHDDKRDDLQTPFEVELYKDRGWTFDEKVYHDEVRERPQGEFYAQSVEIDFVEKKVDVYFG